MKIKKNDAVPYELENKVCVKCLEILEEKDLIDIHIPELGYGGQFDMFDTHIRLCQRCYAESIKDNSDLWCMKKIYPKNNFNWAIYLYDEEMDNFIKSLPAPGHELVRNRFDKGKDARFTEPQDFVDYINEMYYRIKSKKKEKNVKEKQRNRLAKTKNKIKRKKIMKEHRCEKN